MTKTTNALEILDHFIGEDEETRKMIAEASLNAEIAQLIYSARKQANLTQKQLARLMNVDESVIMDLEEADYDENAKRFINASKNSDCA
jgi:ribosome-binding protein aMBF1 (putative translation factor)